MLPQTYEEWLLHQDESNTLGFKMILTHRLINQKRKEFLEKTFEITRDAFLKKVIDDGGKPIHMDISSEEDPLIKARHISTIIDAQHGSSLEEFAGYIYTQALNFYNQVWIWENKSIWQYLTHWFQRKFR